MFLVTTADQRFWRAEEKILFLGEWCKIFNQEQVWGKLDYEVLPYHWDDRSRLFEDYKYIDELYERVLGDLTDKLNKLHNVKYSARYWRIVVGPWLHYFIEILYDRYLSITSAIESGKVTLTWLPSNCEWEVADDFNCFGSWLEGHEYNLFLYSRLIKDLGGVNYEKINVPLKYKKNRVKVKPEEQNALFKAVECLSKMVPDSLNKIVFIASYIKPQDLFRLQASLGQLPYFCINEAVKLKPIDVSRSMRNQIKIQAGKNQFESILPDWVSQQIPKVYVEGYSTIARMARKAYPKKPRVIFTANALFGNEGFKMWAGEKVEKGVKWVGTQHGGSHGMSLWSAGETHEIKVADRYFTWGWKNSDDQRIVPLASARLSWGESKIKNNPSGRILWTGFSGPLYSRCFYSSPVGPQYLDYIDEQKSFLKGVCPAVRKLLLLRLYPLERGWNEIHMWQQLDSSLELYRGAKSSFDQLNESRLSIGTYNGMGILEVLSANYPTIVFWNPDHWELRESAKPLFDVLMDVGIFHDTPQSAATKVNEIYEDVQSWWMLTETQKARKIFCDRFANTSRPIARLKEELLRLL